MVTDLALYDVAPSAGVAADISHIDTQAVVTGYTGDEMGAALANADVVVIPAGVPRKPGQNRDDLFKVGLPWLGGMLLEYYGWVGCAPLCCRLCS